jgi:NitT/TauT family transport system substrate-binding protein
MRPRAAVVAALLAAVALVAGCGSSSKAADASSTSSARTTVHLGYFPNITHATAILGVAKGIFAKDLGADRLETTTFNAGPAAIEALLSGAIDATYIGPSPTINGWAKSKSLVIISGATSGGAALVVKPSITSAAALKGKKVASPQLGNTQDVALRSWLEQQGLKTDTNGGGDVSIVPQENSQTLDAFKSGAIDGAWVPEPWATRLVQEGGGKVLVDEKDLWPGGHFVTTHLIVRTDFLKKHPETVKRLLRGQIEANAYVNAHSDDAQQVVNDAIGKLTGKSLKVETVKAAWANLTFTDDPAVASLAQSAKHAEDVGLLKAVDLTGIYRLGPLNSLLEQMGESAVATS